MNERDDEIERLKNGVSCAALLEGLPPVWRLDRAGSSTRNLKYRRGPGEILVVNHGGRGWWDPLSERKGDVFTLVRHLDPSLSFTAACRVLRRFAGIAPVFPAALRSWSAETNVIPVAQRWARRRRLSRGSAAWVYLAQRRGIPEHILIATDAAGVIREGPHGSAWFAHRDKAACLTGIEMRGPCWRGFSAGGEKTLFQLPGGPGRLTRVAVCEAAIDALSLAALEGARLDTLYVATAGGMGPGTIAALGGLLLDLAADPSARLIAATDADPAGQRYAASLNELAWQSEVRFARIVPPGGQNDWNDALRRGDGCPTAARNTFLPDDKKGRKSDKDSTPG